MSANNQMQSGFTVGNGAAINIETGWIPDYVRVVNLTDGDKITEGFLGGGKQVVPFSSGGTTEIAVGNTIWGVTSNASAYVEQVLLYSGSWSGGDAAGFLVVSNISGTFGSEAVNNVSDSSTADYATVTANVNHSVSTDTEVATETGNNAITQYAGASATNAKGFTIGSGVAEEAKLLFWMAMRG
jgi:hypothetical protein